MEKTTTGGTKLSFSSQVNKLLEAHWFSPSRGRDCWEQIVSDSACEITPNFATAEAVCAKVSWPGKGLINWIYEQIIETEIWKWLRREIAHATNNVGGFF